MYEYVIWRLKLVLNCKENVECVFKKTNNENIAIMFPYKFTKNMVVLWSSMSVHVEIRIRKINI